MGYNGGINKRGYYRREHGMMSKSSVKSGSRIASNIIWGGLGLGLGLISAIGEGVSSASTYSPNISETMKEHFKPQKQKRRFIILGISAILCPIIGLVLYEVADWWMFFSVLILGLIETILCAVIMPYCNAEKYIYEDEQELVEIKCKSNLKILRTLFVTLLMLNLYPLILLMFYLTPIGSIQLAEHIYIWSWDGGELLGLNLILIVIKLFINAMFIKESFGSNSDVWKEYNSIRKYKNL